MIIDGIDNTYIIKLLDFKENTEYNLNSGTQSNIIFY